MNKQIYSDKKSLGEIKKAKWEGTGSVAEGDAILRRWSPQGSRVAAVS